MAILDGNPLVENSPVAWEQVIEAVRPATLLVVVESRMGALLRSRVGPEDILQEALLRAWRDRGTFTWKGLRSFRAWLLTIIDHQIAEAAEHFGAQKRGGEHRHVRIDAPGPASAGERRGAAGAAPGTGLSVPAGMTTPARLAIYREQAGLMGAALEGLPEELREAVRLRIFAQKPIQAIAETLGIGESAVRHRIRKGAELYYRRLRKLLASRTSEAGSAASEGVSTSATVRGADSAS